VALGLSLGLLAASVSSGGADVDRLQRYRQLAAERLGALESSGSRLSGEVFEEMSGLLDEEILENLEAGSVFASEAFLQDRLDAFSEAWGGSAFRVLRLPGGALTVASVQLSPGAFGNSVRVYRRVDRRAEFLGAVHRPGTPRLFAMPSTRAGAAQFLVAWVGPAASAGATALQIELYRQVGDQIRAVWSTADLFGPDFFALSHDVRGTQVTVRYAPRYAGWTLGCERQTEQEDRYRYVPESETFTRAGRRVYNGWHRELHVTVERLIAALRAGDQRALGALAVSPKLWRDLPGPPEPEPACDIVHDSSAHVVTVSATVPGDPRPWGLRFRQTPGGWRLVGVGPVGPLQ
jgi:hypothetical protein